LTTKNLGNQINVISLKPTGCAFGRRFKAGELLRLGAIRTDITKPVFAGYGLWPVGFCAVSWNKSCFVNRQMPVAGLQSGRIVLSAV
jgi:hypothetical protein